MAFWGVLITKGTPNDAEMAMRMAVEGCGMRAVASGISSTAVAVLLIRAASSELPNITEKRDSDQQGTPHKVIVRKFSRERSQAGKDQGGGGDIG